MYINSEKVYIKRFSSGELKFLKSTLNSYIKNNEVEILFLNEESMFELLLVLNYYKSVNVKINLILSYLPYQRMDHCDRAELDTVNIVSKIFNDLNLNSIVICEPHCNIENFINSKSFSYIENLKNKVFDEINFDINKDTIVVTDKGGLKRYCGLSKNIVYFNKVRDLDSGLITKHEIVGSINKNSKVLIVDDIISTGDTIFNVIECIKQYDIDEIFIFSGHFEKNKYNKRLLSNRNVKKIFSTNSLTKKQNKKLKLFDVKEIFYGK